DVRDGTVLRADQGSPVLRRGLDRGPTIRSSRARVSGTGGSADQGTGRVPARRTQQGAVELRAASGHRRAEPGEQLDDQPGGPTTGAEDWWQEPDRGPQAVHRGPRQGPDLDDR